VWKPLKYTIKFDLRGGSDGPGNTITDATKDAVIATRKPTRNKYDFVGWALESDKTKVVYKGGELYSGRKDITLYAVWKVQYFMITFDANGGDSAPVATTGTAGSIKISSDAPKYGGRKFLGWSLARDGAVAYRQGDAYAGNTDIVLYAV
jgi:uncharacterized repeat protein (TIGR02543 family)